MKKVLSLLGKRRLDLTFMNPGHSVSRVLLLVGWVHTSQRIVNEIELFNDHLSLLLLV